MKGCIDDGDCEASFTVRDISLKGVFLTTDAPFQAALGQSYSLRFYLPHSNIPIKAKATLVHEQEGLGFRFDSVDADSMIHLRRLMELNTAGDGKVDRELSFLKP